MTGKANSFQNSLKEDSEWRMGLETLRRASIAHSDTSVQKRKHISRCLSAAVSFSNLFLFR